MLDLTSSLRHAARRLRRAPGFTAVAVITLGLGIGATTALFSAVDSVLLRGLPFPHPDRLAVVSLVHAEGGGAAPDTVPFWSWPKYEAMSRATSGVFTRTAAFFDADMSVTGTDRAERVSVELVTPSYFPLLGVRAGRGRVFDESEGAGGGAPVVVLGHDFWARRFASDPGVLGRTIHLDGVELTIVGVAPEGFHGLTGGADAWVPLPMVSTFTYPGFLDEDWSLTMGAVGRLKDGVGLEVARAAVQSYGRTIEAPKLPGGADRSTWEATTYRLDAHRVDPVLRRAMLVLLGAVAFVLLIVCANVANLLLARGAGRRREIAVRQALGASRARLVAQVLTESVVLAACGGVLGLLVAYWGVALLSAAGGAMVAAAGPSLMHLMDFGAITVDVRVLAFTAGVSILTGLLFGLLPALQATRTAVATSLKEGSGASSAGAGSGRAGGRNALVVAEVALALVLLAGAGLMLRSFARLRGIDPGFRADHVLTFRLDPPRTAFSRADAPAFYSRLTDRLGELPGVRAAAVGTCTPLSSRCNGTIVARVDGRELERGPDMGVHYVGAKYFEALRIPVLRGRGFTDGDRQGAPMVVVVNAAAARKLFPGEDAVGHRMGLWVGAFRDSAQAEIVGVVGDVKYGAPTDEAQPQTYVPAAQYSNTGTFVFLRTAGDPRNVAAAARDVVRRANPDLAVFDVKTMAQRAGDVLARQRFSALLLGLFAGLAVLLAAVGLYGVLAYSVAARTRELGIRIALGARARDVLTLVVGQGARLVGVGLGVGLVAALLLTRVLGALLYDTPATEPATFAAVLALLAAVGLAAAWIPAQRAARVQPTTALREE